MFSSSDYNGSGSGSGAEFAQLQNALWGRLLTTRISLQQVIDEANHFPVLSERVSERVSEGVSGGEGVGSNPLREGLQGVLGELVGMLEQQVPEDRRSEGVSEGARKRSRSDSEGGSEGVSGGLSWEQVLAPQQQLQKDWEAVMNREHARSHFGSEQKKSKLKMFSNSIWDQVSE